MDNSFFPLIGTTGLLLACVVIFVGLVIGFLIFWLYAACLVDVFRKSEEENPDRTIWILMLIATLFVGFMWLVSIVYYIKFKPRLDFWNY